MKKHLLLLSTAAILLSSCDPKPASFTATTENFGPNAVIAINELGTNKVLTAVNIENKAQSFDIKQPTDNFEELKIQDGTREKQYWIYLDNGATTIKLDGKNLYEYPVKEASTPEGKMLIDYYKIKDQRSKTVIDSLEIAKAAINTASPETIAQVAKNLDHWQAESFNLDLDIIKEFAKKNSDSRVSAFLLSKLPGIDDNPSMYKTIYDGFSDDVKKSDVGKDLQAQIAQAMLMSKGSIMPAIEGTNPTGEPFDKAKVLKKVNLIIAWTSYSGKSTTNNQELVLLYDKYKDQDVQFISVSYDKDKDNWLNAIKTQNLTWPQYSDLQGAKSPNAKNLSNYNITYFAIVNKDGKVLTGHDLSMDFVGIEIEKALNQAK